MKFLSRRLHRSLVLGVLAALVATVFVAISGGAAIASPTRAAADEIDYSGLRCQKLDVNRILKSESSPDAGNDKNYRELDRVTCRFVLNSSVAGADGLLGVQFGSTNSSCVPFLSEFRLLTTAEGQFAGPIPQFDRGDDSETYDGEVLVTTSGGISPVTTAGGNFVQQNLSIDFLAGMDGPGVVYFQLQFSDEAAACTGATIHVRLTGITNVSSGNEDVPFPTVESNAAAAVQFSSFNATASKKGVQLRWRTGSEVDTLGFNIYREVKGKRVKVNRSLIASASIGGTAGHSYSYLDRLGLKAKAPRYWLQVVGLDGKRTWHGPTRVGSARS